MEQRTSLILTPRTVVLAFAVAIAIVGTFVYWWLGRRPQAPSEVRLSTCPGGDRVSLFTIQHGLAYDLRDKAFVVDSGIPDMLLGTYHVITHRGDRQGAKLEIGFGEVGVSREIDALSTFSEFSALRDIRTVEGRKIGKDRWGYVKGGDRWRLVEFVWGYVVGYRASPVREAALWDKIIDSPCLLPQPNS
jgi:hypothetical protein